MQARELLPPLLCLLVIAGLACASGEPCDVPGVAEECACGDGSRGARVCSAEHRLSACDCSGSIGLPNPVVPGEGGTGAAAIGGGGGGGFGGSGVSGSGSDDDAGASDGGTDAATGDASVDGSAPDPLLSYRACMADTDCDPGARCTITAGFTNSSFCAPACLDTVDCPVPAGTYDAVLKCVAGYCQLDCTPVIFQPLLSCPGTMTCVAPFLGAALCHAGM